MFSGIDGSASEDRTPDVGPVGIYRARFGPLVVSAIVKFRLRPEIAVELVQNVFLRYFSGRYAPRNAKPWLAKAVFRECVEYKESPAFREEALGGSGDLPDASHDPTADLERRILVGQAVGGLENRSREVLHLHYIQGFTAREIAKRLGTTESYTENLISKGLREAKEALMEGRRKR